MRCGVWLIGARGSVATSAVVGAAALASGAIEATGCVTEQAPFRPLRLPGFGELVFGGHDVADTPLAIRAERLVRSGVIPHGLTGTDAVARMLAVTDAAVRPGIDAGADPAASQADLADRLIADIEGFRAGNDLADVVVIDVSSTEPPLRPHPAHAALDDLEAALRGGEPILPPSSLYTYAALRAGCPVIGFTPSTGIRVPALTELARQAALPYAGCDGKTGETLVKAALAPMFAGRSLRVRSWSGTNLLGGGDGETLADPAAAASKIESKRLVHEQVLGYPVSGDVHIHNVPDLGEWKTAWDNIGFEGFFGARMTMQFTWQGCDSALAAPLVLDLARLAIAARQRGLAGPLTDLAFFFKDPIGTDEHGLAAQYGALLSFADRLAAR
jgi:myo-inositol-1-phosphate synthase